MSAFGGDELWLVIYALPTPMNPGVCCPPPAVPASVENFIPAGRVAAVFAVDDHHAVALRQQRDDRLEAPATGHRVIEHANRH